MKELLKNVFYGNELNKFDFGTKDTFVLLQSFFNVKIDKKLIKDIATSFFNKKYEGVFGGPITFGDSIFIASMMYILKPTKMVEFGVASGISSAFIVFAAKALNLLKNDTEKFLFSFDIISETPEGNKIGQVFYNYYPNLIKYWNLETSTTSLDLFVKKYWFKEMYPYDNILAFVDAGHKHPWPLMDLIYLRESLKKNSWVMFQDIRIMERWLMDTVKFNTPCPPPIRGVELVFNYYPGTRLIGTGLCYNIGALCLDVDDLSFFRFINLLLTHPMETNFEINIIKSYSNQILYRKSA